MKNYEVPARDKNGDGRASRTQRAWSLTKNRAGEPSDQFKTKVVYRGKTAAQTAAHTKTEKF